MSYAPNRLSTTGPPWRVDAIEAQDDETLFVRFSGGRGVHFPMGAAAEIRVGDLFVQEFARCPREDDR